MLVIYKFYTLNNVFVELVFSLIFILGDYFSVARAIFHIFI